jgi:predicted acyl esterase
MNRYYDSNQFIDIVFRPAPDDIVRNIDTPVPMRDGVSLSANVFRPNAQGRYPVILSVSPYGKDQFRQTEAFRPVPGVHLGHYEISDIVAFEAPDPAYWTKHGYVVVHADTRGQGKSEGDTGPFTKQDQLDFYDFIEWAAAQPWSDGNVGLNGVSYLAVSQWIVAQLRPPHLKAMIPWEGWNDFYLRSYFGGIQETVFNDFLWHLWIVPNHNPKSGYLEPDWLEAQSKHPLRDPYWEAKECTLENIVTPALICASFSDQGLHTRDTFEGFKRISSEKKWLFNHRRCKWAAYYDSEALEYQRRFLDHFLKGTDNDMQAVPRVRVEVYENRTQYKVRESAHWPIDETEYLTLYLSAENRALRMRPYESERQLSYQSDGSEQAVFDYCFDADTDLVGNMKLKLWVWAHDADDMDLFVAVKKLDVALDEVYFYGFGGTNPNDCVARGWLRVSHRELDPIRSTPWQPVLKHARELKLKPRDIVPVEIEILPSGTTFRKGEWLRLVVQGAAIKPDAALLGFPKTVNRGRHSVCTGGQYDSHLLVPRV